MEVAEDQHHQAELRPEEQQQQSQVKLIILLLLLLPVKTFHVLSTCPTQVNSHFFIPLQQLFSNEILFYQDPKEDIKTNEKITATQEYIERNKSSFDISKIDVKKCLQFDVAHLSEDHEFISSWPSFLEELSDKPLYTLGCLGLAAHYVCSLLF